MNGQQQAAADVLMIKPVHIGHAGNSRMWKLDDGAHHVQASHMFGGARV